MKKIFTLIALVVSMTSFAAPGPKNSTISISNSDRSQMQVKIDGKMYNLSNTFVLDNIKSGNHSIVIYKMEAFGFRKTQKAIYNTNMFISAGQQVAIDINRSGKVVVKTTNTDKYDRDDRNRGRDVIDTKYDERHGNNSQRGDVRVNNNNNRY